jgi:hypothetical protein
MKSQPLTSWAVRHAGGLAGEWPRHSTDRADRLPVAAAPGLNEPTATRRTAAPTAPRECGTSTDNEEDIIMPGQPSPKEKKDDAARLLTSHPSFSALVDSCGKGYTPTLRVESYISRRHRTQAKYLRGQLAAMKLRVSPAWGTYEGEDTVEVADRRDGFALLFQAVTP